MDTMITDYKNSCMRPAQTGLNKLISKLYIYDLQIKLFYITYDLIYTIIVFECRGMFTDTTQFGGNHFFTFLDLTFTIYYKLHSITSEWFHIQCYICACSSSILHKTNYCMLGLKLSLQPPINVSCIVKNKF